MFDRIDTHAASVFLEGDRALKIKRAVRFPFLDYSTLAKRKAACDEEMTGSIASSRRKSTVAWFRSRKTATDRLRSTADGAPVEYAIEMTRFDERQTIDHLAEAGQLDRAVWSTPLPTRSRPRTPSRRWRRRHPGSARSPASSKATARRSETAACFAADDIDDLRLRLCLRLPGFASCWSSAAAQGHVRRCHGDLHLANIVLIERKPVLFDAIEFDPDIASVDVLYDLAFPHDGFHPLRPAVLPRTPSSTDIWQMTHSRKSRRRSQRFRCSCRCARLSAPTCCLPVLTGMLRDKAEIMQSARTYFRLARQRSVPSAPVLVAVGGLSGTGKSILARALAPSLSCRSREPSCCAPTSCESNIFRSLRRIGCRRARISRRLPRRSTNCSCNKPCAFLSKAIPSWSMRCLPGNRSELRSAMPLAA